MSTPTMKASRPRRGTALLAAILLLITLAAFGSPAQPAGAGVPAATGSIGGTVTDEATGFAIPNITVSASGDSTLTTATASDGTYEFVDLVPGNYDVSFEPAPGSGWIPEWYDDAPTLLDATAVPVLSGGATMGVDAALSTTPGTGLVSGTVTDEVTGLPIEGITVIATDTDAGEAATDVNGNYVIAGIDPGSYQVMFDDCSCQYDFEYYDNTQDPDAATLVTVSADTVTPDIDAALTPFAAVSGIVTDAAGLPVQNASVTIETVCECFAAMTYTDESGHYLFDELPADDYLVSFEAPVGSGLASQWYQNAYSVETATVVTLAPGDVLTDIDATLVAPTGVLKGTVKTTTNTPVDHVRVTFLDAGGNTIGTTFTDTSGRYSKKVPSGTYKIRFTKAGYMPVFNGGASSFDTATPITVDPGSGTITNAALVDAAPISGTVTDSLTSDPVAGIRVNVFDSITGVRVASRVTDANGAYTIATLPAGLYKLQFVGGPSHATKWAGNGGQSKATAAPVPFVTGTTTTYDAALTPNSPPM